MLEKYRLSRHAVVTCLLVVGASALLTIPSPLWAQAESRLPAERCSSTGLRTTQLSHEPKDCIADDFEDVRVLRSLFPRDSGVLLEPVYYGEVFTNAKGGMSTRDATQYQALLDLPLTLDFEAMDLPLPGKFFLLAQNTHGRGLTDDYIGDAQFISNIDSSDNIMQVTEYWWELSLFDDFLAIRLGKQDVNARFLVVNMAQDFLQSSFGLSPSSTFPTYPATSMAATLYARVTESLELKIGVWDALAEVGSWGFSNNNITFTIGEIEYVYKLCDGELPGALDLGAAYLSSGNVAGAALPQGYGYYLQWEQQLYRENPCEEDDTQGLGAFLSYFPRFGDLPRGVGGFPKAAFAGLVYQGLIASRDDDVVGFGVAWAKLNEGGTNQETACEVFYKAPLTPGITVQPDLQYIVTPSGIYPDAIAVGFRFELALNQN